MSGVVRVKRLRWWLRKHRWSIANWRKGYRYGQIQRCRRCDHTTPYHYPTCWDNPETRARYTQMEREQK